MKIDGTRQPMLARAVLVLGVLAFVQVVAASTVTVNCDADAFVYSRWSDTNYGDSSGLNCGDYWQETYITRSYLRFDICNMKDRIINSCTLYLYCTDKVSDNRNVEACAVTDDSWVELEITWDNKPMHSSTQEDAVFIDGKNKWFTLDVTNAARGTQEPDDGWLTVCVKLTTEQAGKWVQFASKDAMNNRPYLSISYTEPEEKSPWEQLTAVVSESAGVGLYNPLDGLSLAVDLVTPPVGGFTTATDVETTLGGTILVADSGTNTVHEYASNGAYIGPYADASDDLSDLGGIAVRCGVLGISCGLSMGASPLLNGPSWPRVALFDGPHSFVGNFIEDDASPADIRYLGDGRALVADTQAIGGGVRLYEADGQSYQLLVPLDGPRQISYMPSTGHYLVASEVTGQVVEFDLAGSVYETWSSPGVRGVYELGNGRLLLGRADGLWSMDPLNPVDTVMIDPEPSSFIVSVPSPFARVDFDFDGDVDLADYGTFLGCYNGPTNAPAGGCTVDTDIDKDGDVDLTDYGAFLDCYNGPEKPPACE
jgi:hypothetical protein